MTIFYDPSCLEYSSPGHPERPERIARTAPVLKDRHPDWEWRKPTAAMDAQLLRDVLVLVDIHLDELHRALCFAHDLFEDRRQLLTRAAPRRPPVEHGDAGLHRLVERRLGHLNGCHSAKATAGGPTGPVDPGGIWVEH